MTRDQIRRILGLSAKIILGLAFLALVMFTVLAKVGGNSPALQDAAEGFIAEISAHRAVITTFKGLYFFPQVRLDFEDLSLYPPHGPQESALVLDRFQMSSDFNDVIFRTGRFRALNIEGLRANPGFIIPAAVDIEKTLIEEQKKENSPSVFYYVLIGYVGRTPARLSIPVDTFGDDADREYRLRFDQLSLLQLGTMPPMPLPIEAIWTLLQQQKAQARP
ncbi:MAG: hypothetical protein L6Q57_07340 [Alphaproteobacteria bacterium]|nr:hypothetical protein [Alphaproteobacteria bacterium]